MERKQRVRAIWGLAGAVLAVAAIVVPLLVLAGSGQATLTAETYADVIRFGVQGAGTLQIQIYDLSERELWDSGEISSDFVDWDRTDTWGERLANGYYLYLAQAWDMGGNLILSKTGKVALLPGDNVQLQTAPAHASPAPLAPVTEFPDATPKAYSTPGNYTVGGSLGVGTETPAYKIDVAVPTGSAYIRATSASQGVSYIMGTSIAGEAFVGTLTSHALDLRAGNQRAGIHLNTDNTVGIGTVATSARLTIQATSGDLIAAYNSTSRAAGAAVFVVKNSGEVRADGAVYAASFNTGSADVAERINTSEWVEAGDVVEIDPDHTGFFRKSADPYSRRVAGIVSTSPGVILGNSTDSETGDWEDNRPVLAIAGRVPTSASAENGPIAVGDLLVSSSTPGVAMRGDPSISIGAVVGKAMEPLDEGEGTIMAQVTLR
jgi:hypothetical protein